jgi:signal transduction histidine kinase/CheY-like chemotaxis protein
MVVVSMEMRTLHLLILEDNPDDAELAVEELKREGFEVEWSRVDDKKTFRKALKENPDLILADYSVPSFGGMDALKMQQKLTPSIPLIIISGTIGEEVAVECLKSGATDYVMKDRLSRLGSVVKRALEEAKAYRDRKAAEEELRKSKEFLSEITSNLPGLVFQYELNTKGEECFTFISDGIRDLMELEPDAVLADTKVMWDTYLEEYIPVLVKEIEESEKKLIPWHAEYQLRAAESGTLKWVEGSSIPKRLPNGDTVWDGWVRDITDRKAAEEELRRLNDALSRKNKELEQVVYISSHDLRSPLVNIQGFTKELGNSIKELFSIVQNKGVPKDLRKKVMPIIEEDIPESMQYILSSIFKMDSLLTGLLNLSRLERAAIKIKKLNMNKLISKVINTFEFHIKKGNAKLEISDLPPCRGDEIQINQVFSNLIDNALKYLDPNRQLIIKISGYKYMDQSIYCVEDNGIGIAPEHQEKIFDIFQQLDPKESHGEGLGLTIVRQIMDKHNGKIWLESEVGKGSKFYVSLPG